MAQATSLSAVGTSTPIGLNPVAKTTIAQVSIVGTSSLDVTVQITLDDIASGTPVWTNISTTHISSTVTADGVNYTILSPVAGLRLSSSTITASGTTVTLKALQSITA